MTAVLEIFNNPIGSLFIHQHNRVDPSFCRKIGLSLSHLVPEILGPKVGLMFH